MKVTMAGRSLEGFMYSRNTTFLYFGNYTTKIPRTV
nr:unnamed protein product [Callosobruchus analis]